MVVLAERFANTLFAFVYTIEVLTWLP